MICHVFSKKSGNIYLGIYGEIVSVKYYIKKAIANSSRLAIASSQSTNNTITNPVINLNPETPVDYDGICLTLKLIGQERVLLQTQSNEPKVR